MESDALSSIVTPYGLVTHADIVAQLSQIDDGDDYYVGDSENNLIDGLAGDDTLRGYHGDDRLYGSEGEDALFGGDGDDVLVGGKGDDFISAGDGNDSILFELGDGRDRLDLGLGENQIAFGSGVLSEALSFQKRYQFDQYYSGTPGFAPTNSIHYSTSDSIRGLNLSYNRLSSISFSDPNSEQSSLDIRDVVLDIYGIDSVPEDPDAVFLIEGRGSLDSSSDEALSRPGFWRQCKRVNSRNHGERLDRRRCRQRPNRGWFG